MNDKKPKAKPDIRTPKPKKTLGLSVPPALRLPHDDLIHLDEPAPISDQIEDRSLDNLTRVNLTTEVTGPTAAEPVTTEAELTRVEMTKAKTTRVNLTRVTVARVGGDLHVPNTILDSLFPRLEPADQLVYLRLFRLSHGFHKDTCQVSLEGLARSIHASRKTVQRAVERLEGWGLIERTEKILGGEGKGLIFTVYLPETEDNLTRVKTTRVNSAYNKEDLKRKYIKIRASLGDKATGASEEQIRLMVINVCAREGIPVDLDTYLAVVDGQG